MSDRGSGSRGLRRSNHLAKGKAVAYQPESSPDTDDKYDAMEDVRIHADASIARNLQAELDAEAAGLASGAARPSSRPGITIGCSARPSGAPRQPTAAPTAAPPARSKRPALLFPQILYQRIMLHWGSDIPPVVAFDRAIPSPLRWRIRHS